MLPSLSVIIPNYNHANCIEGCIESIVMQSLPPSELVVVDDGSKDHSLPLLRWMAGNHPKIRLYSNAINRGVTYSVNRGLELATGDFVATIASDDQLLPGAFEQALPLLAKYPQAGGCAGICEMDNVASGIKHYLGVHISDTPRYLSPDDLVLLGKQNRLLPFTNAMLLRRRAMIEAGEYREALRWHNDWLLSFTIAFRYGLCFVPQVVSRFRVSKDSYSGRGMRNPKEQGAVLTALLATLDDDAFKDVAPRIRESGVLAPFGKEMLHLLLTNRRYWRYLTPAYLRNALWWITRIEAKKLMPKPLIRLYLQLAGFATP